MNKEGDENNHVCVKSSYQKARKVQTASHLAGLFTFNNKRIKLWPKTNYACLAFKN